MKFKVLIIALGLMILGNCFAGKQSQRMYVIDIQNLTTKYLIPSTTRFDNGTCTIDSKAIIEELTKRMAEFEVNTNKTNTYAHLMVEEYIQFFNTVESGIVFSDVLSKLNDIFKEYQTFLAANDE